LPFVDAVAKHWSSGRMGVLTSLRLELWGKLLGRDLHIGLMYTLAVISVITVVDHCGFPRDFKIISEHAKSKDLMGDSNLIIR